MYKKDIAESRFRLFLRFLALFSPYRNKWLAMLLLSGLGALLSLVNPYLTKLVIDKAIINRDLKIFVILALTATAVFFLNGLIDSFRNFLDRYMKIKANLDLNIKVFRKLQSLSFSYFADKSTGEHIYGISYDIERVIDFITTVPPQAIAVFFRLILVLGVVFYLDWRMAALSVILAPILCLPAYYFSRRMKKVWEALIEDYEGIFKNLAEIFSHMQLIKILGKETESIRNYLKLLVGNARKRLENVTLEIFSGFSSQSLSRVLVGLIAFYGGYQVIKGRMTLGSLTAIMVYLTQLASLQGQFVNFFQVMATGLVSCKRVAKVLDERPQVIESKEAREINFPKGEILFREVSFGYNARDSIFKKISFRIEGSSCIALAGPSGSGKTTISNLILRLYDACSGDIIIDGTNIKDLSFSSLKKQIGIVLQEPFLWNDTIRNNIAYDKQKAADEEIMKAARLACLEEFINSLPLGYDTIIGENACKISEGQKQRIAIARAVIKRPKILIFDESFSSVEAEIEARIIDNIRGFLNNSTLVVISHRPSTIKRMDLIYFLSGPDKIDTGTHEELLARNARYENYVNYGLDLVP